MKRDAQEAEEDEDEETLNKKAKRCGEEASSTLSVCHLPEFSVPAFFDFVTRHWLGEGNEKFTIAFVLHFTSSSFGERRWNRRWRERDAEEQVKTSLPSFSSLPLPLKPVIQDLKASLFFSPFAICSFLSFCHHWYMYQTWWTSFLFKSQVSGLLLFPGHRLPSISLLRCVHLKTNSSTVGVSNNLLIHSNSCHTYCCCCNSCCCCWWWTSSSSEWPQNLILYNSKDFNLKSQQFNQQTFCYVSIAALATQKILFKPSIHYLISTI